MGLNTHASLDKVPIHSACCFKLGISFVSDKARCQTIEMKKAFFFFFLMTKFGRWLNDLEYLLLLQSTPIQFPASIWWLTINRY